MDSRIKKKELLEMKTDLTLLLECLDFQKDDADAVKQALVTISSILQASGDAKDVFRDIGGVQQLLTLVTGHETSEVAETGLYCLGCSVERNVYSQELLTTGSVFTFLHGILSSASGTSVRKKQTASFLVLCLVSNNGFGQTLVRRSSCLSDILSLIRTTMPRDTQDLDSEWFEGMDGKSLNLWSTLLSTACACVNNPINEGNQRLCASLLPFLFSLLTSQSDERILRPVLSLIGPTVSGNGSNQDRVRKCGGLEIFVKKLDSLQSLAVCDSTAKLLTVQLLSTVDCCISDNECNSKRFGELGGIKLVLALLSQCCLDLSEKIQAVLTLAHALDAYNGNQKFITECGGVTVLIQQLTETQDEELSKTIKYLLHMCVSSGKGSLSDAETDLTDTERLINKMEAMKRHNDVEMLNKIRELDSKVKSMEGKHQHLDHNQNEKDTPNLNTVFERLKGFQTSVYPVQTLEPVISEARCHGEHSTPREKSLMEQLIKEKNEKEHLEKLNHMLQENICKTRTELTNARTESKTEYITTTDQQTTSGIPADTGTAVHRNSNHNSSTVLQEVPYTSAGSFRTMGNICTVSDPVSPMVTRSGLKYQWTDVQGCRYSTSKPDINNNFPGRHKNHIQNNVGHDTNGNPAETTELDQSESNLSYAVSSYNTVVQQQESGVKEFEAFPFVAAPLDLSCNAKNVTTEWTGVNQAITANVKNATGNVNSDSTETTDMNKGNSVCHLESKIKTTINKNAEIQCGTPWINKLSDNTVAVNANVCMNDSSSQTNFVKPHKPQTNSGPWTENLNSKRSLIEKSDLPRQNTENTSESTKHLNHKIPAVTLADCETRASAISDHTKAIEMRTEKSVVYKSSPASSANIKSTGFFVKPTALPPKRKVRVTPLLGSNKLTGTTFLSSKMLGNANVNNSSKLDEYDSDIQSEFDLDLFKNVARKHFHVRPTPVIKSQNNVRQVDKVVEQRERNAAEKWQIHPSTPHRQGIVPPRPAFSDCGTRRCVLETPFSVKSQGTRRRSLDDSGIHSPRDMLNISPQSPDGSPVDSNIDEFRSSSDVSDEEDRPPNISAAVLRSSKKLIKKSENKCPGCTGFYSSGGGLELNSRTYNIALETDPNTCPMHRKLRQIERVYINRIRKTQSLRNNVKRKLCSKATPRRSGVKPQETIYDFTSESADNISPLSEDNEEFQPPSPKKERRKRVPYSEEEERNLVEGVNKLGKHWNQILTTYSFHPSRTNVDLMDKYKRMRALNSRDAASSKNQSVMSRVKTYKPFSMCEERRLRRGIMKFGYNWKTILSSFTFAQGRTTEDLRNKWRILHKKL